jgi:hypothetical protein
LASSFLFSGCSIALRGVAMKGASEAKEHPASQIFTVHAGKNDTFNAAMHVMTAKDRKITLSDRESGTIQGAYNDNAVSINITGLSASSSSVDVTVAYNAVYSLGDPKMQANLDAIKSEIESITGRLVSTATSTEKQVMNNEKNTPSNAVKPVVLLKLKAKKSGLQ